MKENLKFFFLISCLILLLIQIGSANDTNGKEQDDVKVFDVGQVINSKATNGRVFSGIDVKELKSKYLFIKLELGLESKNIPMKLYVYQEGNPNPLKICENDEVDSCYLTKQSLKPNTKVLVLSDSTVNQYSFTLRTSWSDLQHLKPGNQIEFYFAKQDQSQLYHLELQNTDFHELRIILKPQTMRSAFDKIRIYGSFGKDKVPSSNSFDFKSIHLWQDAEGIFLYGKQIKDKNMNILIQGEIQTVYKLSCQVIKTAQHNLTPGQTIHQYLEPGEDFTYGAKFYKDGKHTKLQYDEFVLTFSGFSGKLNLGFYTDEKRTKPLQIQPFAYLSDAQYVFKKEDIQKKWNWKNGIFVYVHALERKSVYSITFYGRNKIQNIKLSQNIYQFIQVPPSGQQVAYFQILYWADDTRTGDLEYSVSLTNVLGQNEIQFYTCVQQFSLCSDHFNPKQQKPIKSQIVTIGTKKNYHLSFRRSQLKNINGVQSAFTVLAVIKNKNLENKKQPSMAAIQYRPQNKLYFLREAKPLETRIKQQQYKIFKYTNQDPFLKEIKIYINQISGKVDVFSLRQEPARDNPYGNEETSNVLSFTKDLTSKPIFIVVKGMEESIFSIQLISVHKSDNSLSTLTLTQDLDFSLKIKPQGSQILQVVPVFDAIFFQYKASGSVLVCAVDQATNDCQKDYKPTLNKDGKIDIQPFHDRNKLFKIMNPSQSQYIKVTAVYHSKDYVHCQQRAIGTLYYQTIHKQKINENGFQKNCFSYHILQHKDFYLSLSRIDLGQLHFALAVCGNLMKTSSEISGEKLKISQGYISKSCQGVQEKSITLMISPHKNQEQKNKVIMPSKLKYLLEYADQKVITIPDGVAYDFQAKTTQSPVKVFFYEMINQKDTTVKLSQYLGYGSLSILIVPTGKRQSMIDSINNDYVFTKGDSYFLNPTLTIKEEDLKKKQCKDCTLIIKVFSVQQIGVKVHFGLEVTQNHNQLQDHSPKDGFLTRGSFDYYGYTTLDTKFYGSLIVEVNDNGRQCVKIYLSDDDYPDEKNYIARQQGNQLVYKDVQPSTNYYISVQAIEDCPYSITVSSTKIPLTKLRRGYNNKLSLDQGEIKYFLIEHLQKKQFKIISILKYGETDFYMNRTSSSQIESMMQKQISQIDYKKFQIKSQWVNRIVLHKNNSYLEKESFYIIAVEGKTATQGFLFYGDSDTSVQIMSDTLINDQLSVKDERFSGQYYGDGNITLEVKVLAGEVKAKIQITDTQKPIQKTYAQDRSTYQTKFSINSSLLNFFLREPSRVTFTATKAPAIYSFKFTRVDNNNKNNPDLTSKDEKQPQMQAANNWIIYPGQPNDIILVNSAEQNQTSSINNTISGVLTHNQDILINVDIKDKQIVSKFEIECAIQAESYKCQKSIVRNILKINFPGLQKKKQEVFRYQIKIKTPQSIEATVYQNYGINLLLADDEVLVEGQQDYLIYPESSVLLDVFECESKAKILYSNNRNDLDVLQMKQLEMYGMPNQPHAIKIVNPGTTFIRIDSKKSFFRWLPIDSAKEKGMGYLNYDIGKITYSGSLLDLTVQWESVYTKRQTKTKLMEIEYVLILGTSTDTIQGAINCENYNDPSLKYIRYKVWNDNVNQRKNQIALKKFEIIQKYSQNQNLFIGLVADVSLKIPDQEEEDIQHYRFVYSTQQIPLQVFKDYAVASKDIWILVALGTAILLFFSFTVFICVTKIYPICVRLRGGNQMVQDQKEDKQFDVIPPSSDRNQVNHNNLQSEEGMK